MESRQSQKAISKTDVIQNIIMENRKKISVSGIEDIESFNEQQIILYSCCGVIIIEGNGMHISKLSVENGETVITGNIDSVVYHDNYGKKEKTNFFARLLR